MSLILDALRKSEAERRRGQAPDLFAPAASRAMPASKQPVAVIGVALATILAAAAIVFWPGQPSRKPVSSEEVEPATAPTPEKVAPIAMAPVTTNTANATIHAPKPPSAAPIETVRKPVVATPITTNSSEQVSAVPSPPPAATDTNAVALPVPDVADDSSSNNEPALPGLATLDSATRATLPPLQLSMHVWNQDASRRFAIIDGQRLGEGGKLSGAVVAEIRRDGVVLDIGGRQFLLPRP